MLCYINHLIAFRLNACSKNDKNKPDPINLVLFITKDVKFGKIGTKWEKLGHFKNSFLFILATYIYIFILN